MKKFLGEKNTIRIAIFFLIVILLYVAVFSISIKNIKESMYNERGASTLAVMSRITKNVEIGMNARWQAVNHLSHQFSGMQLKNIEEAEAAMLKLRSSRTDEIVRLFLVDESGTCYLSGGMTFEWAAPDMLKSGKEELYISSTEMQFSDDDNTYMYFLQPLSEIVNVDGKNITHMVLCCEMSFLDYYFDINEEYGKESVGYVIRENGDIVYVQGNDHLIPDRENVFVPLSKVDFYYDISYDNIVTDIENGDPGFVRMSGELGENNFIYYPMTIEGYTAVMVVPTRNIGGSLNEFMWSVTTGIIIITAGALIIIMAGWAVIQYRMNKKRREVTEQLEKAAEAERSANNAKTQFLSSMSHDIRTPMNAIVGLTALATSHLDDKDYIRGCLKKITLASNHLLTLVNDVLDISKVESGMMSLNPVIFSLVESVDSLTNIVCQQIDAKKQEFDIRVHNVDCEYLFADELRLNQIFINILTNAVKYTSEGGKITVDIIEEHIKGSNDMIRLIYIVEDNGIGMSEEFQEHMYDSFSRARDKNLNNIQGTGLGLAICKQMVNLMDGTIECVSSPGNGTKFTVTLDIKIADKLVDDLMLPPMKMLLVDDDDIFLESATETLKSMGVSTDCVTNGHEAIKAVLQKHEQGHDYPVVIIDWQMPDMDGFETTRCIRDKVGDSVPIIVISAYDNEDMEEQALAAGANGFIRKPFFKSSVYNNLRDILGIVEEKETQEENTYSGLKGMKLLVAEDNDLNWEIAEAILEMYGMISVRAKNGQECVDIINSSDDYEYDLILMDIQMPVMDGYEATIEIRSSERDYVNNIPIVAMTADAFAEDIQRCIESGMNAHLSKPINIDNLLMVLENRGGVSTNISNKRLIDVTDK